MNYTNPITPSFFSYGVVSPETPLTRLSELFNVNHFIVSQANPYIVPFMSRGLKNRKCGRSDRFGSSAGWAEKIARTILAEIKHRMGQVTVDRRQMSQNTSYLSFWWRIYWIVCPQYNSSIVRPYPFFFAPPFSWIKLVSCLTCSFSSWKKKSLETWQLYLKSNFRTFWPWSRTQPTNRFSTGSSRVNNPPGHSYPCSSSDSWLNLL